MKKLLLCFYSFIVTIAGMNAQTKADWTKLSSKSVVAGKNVQRADFPENFILYKIDLASLNQKLQTSQNINSKNAKSVVIEIPNTDGKLERFKMFESSNFDAALQARFPDIRAYAGQGIDDKYAQVYLSISPSGIQTMTFRAEKSTEYIETYSDDKSVYAVYKRSDKTKSRSFNCETIDEKLENSLLDRKSEVARSSDVVKRAFRLAMSVTGEYSAYHGGTTASVLAAVNNTMTRVNGVYEKDLAIRMNLVNNTTILYLNAATDPYGPDDTGYNAELQITLDAQVGSANYDVGHLMSAIGNNGNAGCIGCVCNAADKGSGYTTSTTPVGDTFDIDFVVHELGHQFGGNHTFSFGTENSTVNFEVGSGVTIMGYAGITPYDVAPNSIDTFHAGSIAQIQANMSGKTCDVETPITHGAPVVNAGGNWTIPLSTPFILTGSATDTGGITTMTYQWEQYNDAATAQLGASSVASPTKTAGPNFRSYLPTASGARRFPLLASTLAASKTTAGTEIIVEALSSVARSLNFRLTARDNVLNGGQTNFGTAIITVANQAALDITSQATDGVSYATGSNQTVTWTSAGNSTIAGAATVDISFSSNNGLTFTTLLAGTPNDGSQQVTLPTGVSAPFCRFMVKANANIFYNINTKPFAVGFTVVNSCNTYTNNTPIPIVDQAPGNFTTRTLNIPASATIGSISVFNNISHTYLSDVTTDISSPSAPGTFVKVFSRFCGANNTDTNGGPLNLKFSTGAGAVDCVSTALQTAGPGGDLTSFNGQNANGVWTFRVYDNFTGDTGTINSWGIEVCTQTITSLSAQDFEFANFSLFPNPNNGNFTLKFNSETSNDIKINVFDMRGRNVYVKSYTNTGAFNEDINLDKVQGGVYLVAISDGDLKTVKRIVVQ